MAIRVYHRDNPGIKVPLISKDARLIVWYGVGAKTANMNYVVLEPGESNVPHIHRESEDSIYILEGEGTVEDFTNGEVLAFKADQVVHVPIGVKHAVSASKDARVVSVGGPCPADMDMLRAIGAVK